MNQLLNPNQFCESSTIGGIKRVWVAQRQWFGRFWLYSETSNLQYGQIIGHVTANQSLAWYRILERRVDGSFTQTQTLSPSRVYTQTLSLNFNQMDIEKRDSFEQLVVCKDPVFIFQDFNDNYWLIGESNGCRVDFNGKTDSHQGFNDFSLIISCNERYPIRQLSDEYISTYVDVEIKTLCEYTMEEICDLTWTDICSIPR